MIEFTKMKEFFKESSRYKDNAILLLSITTPLKPPSSKPITQTHHHKQITMKFHFTSSLIFLTAVTSTIASPLPAAASTDIIATEEGHLEKRVGSVFAALQAFIANLNRQKNTHRTFIGKPNTPTKRPA